MSDKKRGDDAQDHTPAAAPVQADRTKGQQQEAPNYETHDKGQAIEVEDLSSAVDEGAN